MITSILVTAVNHLTHPDHELALFKYFTTDNKLLTTSGVIDTGEHLNSPIKARPSAVPIHIRTGAELWERITVLYPDDAESEEVLSLVVAEHTHESTFMNPE